jgi:hypothetical protein
MISEFEEGEYRGPLFNQLERGSHLLWEPGQVFEKSIGIDRASRCLNDYLWSLYGYTAPLAGITLRGRPFSFIWGTNNPTKLLPDFSLNLFIQAKRATYSSQSKVSLAPHITGQYWYFDITPHQQIALEQLEAALGVDALVVYASPAFHLQQNLYNHTSNQTIVENSTFPKASALTGHSKWYYDSPGTSGVANPDFEFIDGEDIFKKIESLRQEKGIIKRGYTIENLIELANKILKVVESQSEDFRASQFANYKILIENYIQNWDLKGREGLKEIMQIYTFNYLWKIQWMTF